MQFWYPLLSFGSQHRIPKHLFFLVFWVYTADFGFVCSGIKLFGYFPEVPVTKIRVSAPAPYAHKPPLFGDMDVVKTLSNRSQCRRITKGELHDSRIVGLELPEFL